MSNRDRQIDTAVLRAHRAQTYRHNMERVEQGGLAVFTQITGQRTGDVALMMSHMGKTRKSGQGVWYITCV